MRNQDHDPVGPPVGQAWVPRLGNGDDEVVGLRIGDTVAATRTYLTNGFERARFFSRVLKTGKDAGLTPRGKSLRSSNSIYETGSSECEGDYFDSQWMSAIEIYHSSSGRLT